MVVFDAREYVCINLHFVPLQHDLHSFLLSPSFLSARSIEMAFTGLTGSAKDEFVVSTAILALHDGGVSVNAENINKLVAATGNTAPGFLAGLYSKLVASRNIDDILMTPGSGGGGGGGVAAPAAAGGSAPAAAGGAAKKEEKKEEVVEEAFSGAGGLFGDDDE